MTWIEDKPQIERERGKAKGKQRERASSSASVKGRQQRDRKAHFLEFSVNLILVGTASLGETFLNPIPTRERRRKTKGQLEGKEREEVKQQNLLEWWWPRSVVHFAR